VAGNIVDRLRIPPDCINNPHCPHRAETAARVKKWEER
jgi:hypothetical protein